MKAFLLFFIMIVFMLPANLKAKSEPDSLFAIPDSNRVTLWDLHAYRNCAAEYRMEIIRDGQHITWIQRDTNGYAYCNCHFDYNVRFGPLSPGDYTADVFFTEAYDSTLNPLGSISFSILEPLTDSSVVFEPFSSKCGGLYLGTRDLNFRGGSEAGQNYPNPFREYSWIPVFANAPGNSEIEFFNATGNRVKVIRFSGSRTTEILFDATDDEGRKLPPGIYYYHMKGQVSKKYYRMVIIE